MNRNYSRDGLLKMYQKEAGELRDKRLNDKQSRIMEEKRAIDVVNKELEDEKAAKKNAKLQRMNEMRQEYQDMVQKQDQRRTHSRRKEPEIQGSLKIGCDNREIKRKSYDEVTNNLVLNPTKQPIDSGRQGRNEAACDMYNRNRQRGKSQSFNIINHADYQSNRNLMPNRIENTGQHEGPQQYNSESYFKQNEYAQEEPTQKYHNHREERVPYQSRNTYQPSQENFPTDNRAEEEHRAHRGADLNEDADKRPPEYDDPEFQKYYEEYVRRKMREEAEQAGGQPQFRQQPDGRRPDNIQNENPYLDYMNNQQIRQEDPHQLQPEDYEQVEGRMHNLNINADPQRNTSEYFRNKMRNGGNSLNPITNKENNCQTVNNAASAKDSVKCEKQENYRNFLQSQIDEKSNIKKGNYQMFRTHYNHNDALAVKLKKSNVNNNPYSTKNFEFGGSNLSVNPITNPVNSYNFNANLFRQGPVGNGVSRTDSGRERLRGVGNNIMK